MLSIVGLVATLPTVTRAGAAAGQVSELSGQGDLTLGRGDGLPAAQTTLVGRIGVTYAGGRAWFTETEGAGIGQGSRLSAVGADGILRIMAGAQTGADKPRPIPLHDGGPATQAPLFTPRDVKTDAAGNLYIADRDQSPSFGRWGLVRRVDAATGIITTVAGSDNEAADLGDGGLATSTWIGEVGAVALDGAGNLFLGHSNNGFGVRVRRVDAATGIITTVAGGGSGGDGGLATGARLTTIEALYVDSGGNLFIGLDGRVRRVDAASGIITTWAGGGAPEDGRGDGGPATAAALGTVSDIAADSAGNLFLAAGGLIRRVDRVTGVITTVAGGGEPADGLGDGGPATAAQLRNSAQGLAFGPDGSLFIGELGRMRRVGPDGIITTVAGVFNPQLNGERRYLGDGPGLGTAVSPQGMVVDGAGVVFAQERTSASEIGRVRRYNPATGLISTVAGGGIGDGFSSGGSFLGNPKGLASDGTGNVFIADCHNRRVRRVDAATGIITTVAGSDRNALSAESGDGGPALSATLVCPQAVAVGPAGDIYIAEGTCTLAASFATLPCPLERRLRRVDPAGTISTVIPRLEPGLLTGISGVAVDASGNVFVSDSGNHRILRVTRGGVVTTAVGTGGSSFGVDGIPASSSNVVYPGGLAVDSVGRLLIAETGSARIRRVGTDGIITTVAGNGIAGYTGVGGPATSATMDSPGSVAADPAGNIYIGLVGVVWKVEPGSAAVVAPRHTADCGKTIMSNLTLTYDIGPCPGDGLLIGKDGITVNLDGHRIIGDAGRTGNDVGIRLTGRSRVKIQGGATSSGLITGFDAGIAIIGGADNTVNGLTVANNQANDNPALNAFGDGVVVFFAKRNRITNNVISGNGPFDGVGILGNGADDNLVQDNTIESTTKLGTRVNFVGLGVALNPFLFFDRPRGVSLFGNQIIGNVVRDNDFAGISNLSNVNGVIKNNTLDNNGNGGTRGTGVGIGVNRLQEAQANTNVLVKGNVIRGSRTRGLEVGPGTLGNTITNNVSTQSGQRDLRDFNQNCGTNKWFGNVWGSGGYEPDCVTTGGYGLDGSAPAPALVTSSAEVFDPPPRKAPPR